MVKIQSCFAFYITHNCFRTQHAEFEIKRIIVRTAPDELYFLIKPEETSHKKRIGPLS